MNMIFCIVALIVAVPLIVAMAIFLLKFAAVAVFFVLVAGLCAIARAIKS